MCLYIYIIQCVYTHITFLKPRSKPTYGENPRKMLGQYQDAMNLKCSERNYAYRLSSDWKDLRRGCYKTL